MEITLNHPTASILDVIFDHYGRVINRSEVHKFLSTRIQDRKTFEQVRNRCNSSLGACAGLNTGRRQYFLVDDYLPDYYFGKKEWLENGILPDKYKLDAR